MIIFMVSMANCIEEVQENLLKQNEKKMVIYYEKCDGNSKRIAKMRSMWLLHVAKKMDILTAVIVMNLKKIYTIFDMEQMNMM